MSKGSARQPIRRLHEICRHFGPDAGGEKETLLETIGRARIRRAADARRLHDALCYLRAFPDSADVYRRAATMLTSFADIVDGLPAAEQSRLVDSGIAGTDLYYRFSYEVACWLARTHPGVVRIDWGELAGSERLDELLVYLLEHAESDYFDSGHVGTEEWLTIAGDDADDGGFCWLMAQLADRHRLSRFWTALYNAADVPLHCRLADSGLSRSKNVLAGEHIHCRASPMRRRVPNAKREIGRPLRDIVRLDPRSGAKAIDVAMAALAVRHRETHHFNYANAREVFVAEVGEGTRIVVTGLKEEHRFPLETTMGFLIVCNDVPVGYGGSSTLYHQANTGINIFNEFRGSEAAWFWVQVMRTISTMTRCNRFVANPYQFGAGNTEALKSGAFWFYYRLGYRPVDSEIRQLAAREFRRLCGTSSQRTPRSVLKALASCDMHLKLPGARDAEFFEESWLEFAALLATRALAASGEISRRKARDRLAKNLLEELGIDSLADWSRPEREWFLRLAPIVSALSPGTWSATDRARLVALMRAKGGGLERDFALEFGRAEGFFRALKAACRRIAREH